MLELSNEPLEREDAMSMDSCQRLRAIVRRTSAGVQAQLLELDLAVQGENTEQLLDEIAHALIVSYEIAIELGEAPFSNLAQTPKSFRQTWRDEKATTAGCIELPDEVALALATALHVRKPIRSVALEEALAA